MTPQAQAWPRATRLATTILDDATEKSIRHAAAYDLAGLIVHTPEFLGGPATLKTPLQKTYDMARGLLEDAETEDAGWVTLPDLRRVFGINGTRYAHGLWSVTAHHVIGAATDLPDALNDWIAAAKRQIENETATQERRKSRAPFKCARDAEPRTLTVVPAKSDPADARGGDPVTDLDITAIRDTLRSSRTAPAGIERKDCIELYADRDGEITRSPLGIRITLHGITAQGENLRMAADQWVNLATMAVDGEQP